MRKTAALNITIYLLLILSSCVNKNAEYSSYYSELEKMPIIGSVLDDTASFYFVDTRTYPVGDGTLPIGVFDSGTGGLTVLEAILTSDSFNNRNNNPGADSVPDFSQEDFIYLADQANMPYGVYFSEGKSDLLVEHVIKDATFLLSQKYYPTDDSEVYSTGKKPVKAIVIACNTATAYGALYLDAFMEKAGLKIKVLGVIDAGARGALELFGKDEAGTIGVLATVGTVASDGYYNSIVRIKEEMGYRGKIEIFSWGGHGIAEAVDEEPDFINSKLIDPRREYKGPSLSNESFKIDTGILDVYNFDFSANKMLCDSDNPYDCTEIQINDAENYMRYHVVSLFEMMRAAPGSPPLKTIILGCTHYPYLTAEIRKILSELYDFQRDGKYVYRHLMAEEIVLVDPSVNLAKELYAYLAEESLFNNQSVTSSGDEFYISVPNISNPAIIVDENRRFTYEYKYGRVAGEVQEYVKVVPFSRRNISDETLSRLQKSTPYSYKAVVEFNATSNKTTDIKPEYKIVQK